MANLAKDTNFDQILRYMQSDDGTVTLSDKQKDLLDRWIYADGLIRQYHADFKIVPMIRKRFGEKNISVKTAYRDINNARKLFGSMSTLDAKYVANFVWNATLSAIKRAIAKKDTKSEAMLIRELRELCKMLHVDPNAINWRDMIITNIQVVTDPATIGLDPMTPADIEELRNKFAQNKRRRLEIGAE